MIGITVFRDAMLCGKPQQEQSMRRGMGPTDIWVTDQLLQNEVVSDSSERTPVRHEVSLTVGQSRWAEVQLQRQSRTVWVLCMTSLAGEPDVAYLCMHGGKNMWSKQRKHAYVDRCMLWTPGWARSSAFAAAVAASRGLCKAGAAVSIRAEIYHSVSEVASVCPGLAARHGLHTATDACTHANPCCLCPCMCHAVTQA